MSDLAQREASAADMSAAAARLGEELRARRQSLGWALPDLAASLRIRQPYLEAIEAGRIGDLPGTTYALGFVRAYASALGLSGEQVAGRFRAQSAEANIRPALSFPAPVPQRGVPAGALMLLGLVLLAGAYAGWYYVSEHQSTPPETVPPIPDRLLPQAAEKPAPSPQVASILPGASPPTQPPLAAQPTAAPPNPAGRAAALPAPPKPGQVVAAQAGAPAAGLPQSPLPVVQAPPSPGVPAPSAPASPAGVASPSSVASHDTAANAAAPASRMVVKAVADAWVTVKQNAGPALFNKLMHAGDSWAVPASASGLTLTTGNAGGTEIDVDGAPVASLGGSGMVRRDLPLDADMLKSGHLPPNLRARPRPAPVTGSRG